MQIGQTQRIGMGATTAANQSASGIYFYQLQADHFYAIRKMVILK